MSQKPSLVTNCMFISSHEQDGVMLDPNNRDDGSLFVYMDRYLICPLDMFTPEEIEAASRKYTTGN